MKKIILYYALLFCIIVNAQMTTKIDTIQNIDELIKPLNKKSFNSGILYDRVFPIAKLNTFNTTNNTSNLIHFEQALSELYRASKKTKFSSVDAVRKKYTSVVRKNSVDVGIINTTFNQLNYNDKENNKGALKLTEGKLTHINSKPIFLENHILVVAPLKKYAVGQNITYNFKKNLVFQETDKKITNLTVDFGTKKSYTIFNKGQLIKQSVSIRYTKSGYKTLQITATFADGTRKTTSGKLFITASSNNTTQSTNDNGIENGAITATIPFTGYEAGDTPILGQLEYRIFYHGTPGNYIQTLLKPIVIIDGFDPFDKRKIQDADNTDPDLSDEDHESIEDLMSYKVGINTVPIISKLRELGYDVVIVNHPIYDTPSGETIDGGADYIERNAMAHVALYQYLNTTVFTNGSSEELIIMGPSMGGQISRYALAYMEEHGIDHNTKLWVSIDSPHLGANILVGGQANLYFLGYIYGDQKAKDQYDHFLNSPAGKQQLLVQHSYNSTSLPPYFQQYHTNLESNLPTFNGFPQIPRSIAIVNGSLSKSTNTAGQKVLDVRGFTDFLWFPIKGFQNEEWFMKDTGQNNKIFYGMYVDKNNFSTHKMTTHFTNPFVYGSLDALPGGMADTQGVIKTALIEALEEAVDDPQVRTYVPNHAFVPTVSALAFKNSNFKWSDRIDRNLVCTNEIPFDTYYAPQNNEDHIYFTQESVDWLFEELAGNQQYPTVYLENDDLIGENTICYNQTRTYYFEPCRVSEVTWETHNSLQILSSTSSSITVRNNNQNPTELWIKATVENNTSVTKQIFGGTYINADEIDDYLLIDGEQEILVETTNSFGNEIQWKVNGIIANNNTGNDWMRIYFSDYPCINNQIVLSIRKSGACGWSNWVSINYSECEDDFFRFSSNPMKSGGANNKVIIIEENDKQTINENRNYTISIFNRYGRNVYHKKQTNREFKINNLQKGFYIVRFKTKKGNIITKKLIIN